MYVFTSRATYVLIAWGAAAGFAIAMVLASTPNGLPDAWVRPIVVANADLMPTEDSPGWDCKTMGNRVCGDPGNLDMSNPFDRCLAAMADAEIPADMWECYEYPRERP